MDWCKFIWAALLQGCLAGPIEPPIYPDTPEVIEMPEDEDDEDDDDGGE